MQSIIVDSGALVAMFDVSEARHQSATEIVKAAGRAPLLSTWPCVTEASHILERLDWQLALLTFVRRGSFTVRDFTAADLDRIMGWMKKYRDHPMDFADASLVCAERLLEEGKRDQALALYATLSGSGMPKPARLAAMSGIIREETSTSRPR